jgi:hypothetical protein
MFRNKKGDLSINLIVVAAIAMIILVVMILIFTNKISVFQKSCVTDVNGVVKPGSECGYDTQTQTTDFTCIIAGTYKDVVPGQVCCIRRSGC